MSVAAGLLAAACVLFAPGVSVKKTVLPSGVAVHEMATAAASVGAIRESVVGIKRAK